MGALGRLAASITHEINNPLQAVISYLTLAQEELAGAGDKARMTRYLNTVGNELERIAAIVRRMRDFYRPASEGFKATDIHAVLESVLELTYKQLQHSKVKVVREWNPDVPIIQANPDHLKQVFLNLVLNAIDAMPKGGILHIATSLDQIHVDETSPPRSAVQITFSDTGEGIPPEILPRLFEPFSTTKEHGTGLGLSISYGIIKAHNGEIQVESHAGMGTTFTLLLPTTKGPEPVRPYLSSAY
jgi:two-component system NtrC family sensor kinase